MDGKYVTYVTLTDGTDQPDGTEGTDGTDEINVTEGTIVRCLGTNLTFLELLETVQRGTFLQQINVGPIRVHGNIFSRYSSTAVLLVVVQQ